MNFLTLINTDFHRLILNHERHEKTRTTIFVFLFVGFVIFVVLFIFFVVNASATSVTVQETTFPLKTKLFTYKRALLYDRKLIGRKAKGT